MPKKVNYPEPWNPPTKAQVRKVVEKLGGAADVSRLLEKNITTVKRWCWDGDKSGIDKGNWHYLNSIC